MNDVKTIPQVPILICECGEPLCPIPKDRFGFVTPAPYAALGAPYDGASPFMLRQSVLTTLLCVAERLEKCRPGWKIRVHDAYRPLAVQAFMVEHEFKLVAASKGINYDTMTPAAREELAPLVYRIWARPNNDPAAPPPHTTGAAIDCTLQDERGAEIPMGSPIDENSERSLPGFFEKTTDAAGQQAHQNRLFLQDLMEKEGFIRLRDEWWHFSLGDRYWAKRLREKHGVEGVNAIYGFAPPPQ